MEYWLGVLQAQIPTVMEKAIASENHTKGAITPAPFFLVGFGRILGELPLRIPPPHAARHGVRPGLTSHRPCSAQRPAAPSMASPCHCCTALRSRQPAAHDCRAPESHWTQMHSGGRRHLGAPSRATSRSCARRRTRMGSWAWRTSSRCARSACASLALKMFTGAAFKP